MIHGMFVVGGSCFSESKIQSMDEERRRVWLERQEDLNRTATAKKMVADAMGCSDGGGS